MKRLIEVEIPKGMELSHDAISLAVQGWFNNLGATARDVTAELTDLRDRFSKFITASAVAYDEANGEHLEPGPATREVEWGQTGSLNPNIQIIACGAPTPGGAQTLYQIIDASKENIGQSTVLCELQFHHGATDTVRGITNESLLAVVADRLAGFEAGPYSCVATVNALADVRSALDQLGMRTVERIERGVEGKLEA